MIDQLLEYSGNISGLIVERTPFKKRLLQWQEGSREQLYLLKFDEYNRLIEKQEQKQDEHYSYNDSGSLAAIYRMDKKKTLLETELFEYDEMDQLTSRKISSQKEDRLITYDQSKTDRVKIEKEGEHIQLYKWNDQNLLISEYSYNGDKPDSITAYFYNEYGQIIRIEESDSLSRIERITYYKYNGSGQISEEKIVDSNKDILFYNRFEYPAGECKNWLSRIQYAITGPEEKDFTPIETIYRAFTLSPNPLPENIEQPIQQMNISTLAFPNGIYRGEVENEMMSGEGIFEFNDGSVYRGSFFNNSMNGFGEFEMCDGRIYKGEFKNGSMDGKGSCTWPDGSVYEGRFSNNLMDGEGLFSWNNGDSFHGLFEKGKRTDQGIFTPGQ